MSESEKIDVLDFVLNVLKEHEKMLDALTEKFEGVLKNLSAVLEGLKPTPGSETKPRAIVKCNINILCEEWGELKEACKRAEVVSFQLDDELRVSALQENIIYEYREAFPKRVESMKCGIPAKFQGSPDQYEVRKFLSRELNVTENKIMKGQMQFYQ